MAIDTQALAGQINAIYESTLGRPADMEGLMYFANAIMSGGGSLADVQQAIASSPEARGLQTGRQGQTGQTGSGTATPAATVQPATGGGGLLSGANIDSQALAGQINNIFLNKLGRAATVDDIMYFGNAIMSGAGTLADAERDIGASKEAQGLLGTTKVDNTTKVGGTTTTGGTNTDNYNTINSIFRTVLGRDVDPTGAKYWGDLLASGTSIADITAGIRGSAEAQTPAVQQFQKGIRTVPFGSQLMGGNVQQMAQYAQPAAQAGPAMDAPSLQGFLGSNPAAATLSPFQQQMQYQAALPSMIQPFNPADIPATYQQTLSPTPRLDISSTTIPSWLQTAIDAQRAKDGVEVSDLQKFNTANQVSTNSGLGPVTPGGTGNLASGGIDPRIVQGYTQNLGRVADMPGAQYWQGLLSGGTPIADITAGIAGSPEGLLYAQNQAAKAAANASTQYYNE
jgi:hypothetical protein